MGLGLCSWEVRNALYEHGRQQAINDLPNFRYSGSLGSIALDILEREAYDLMHSLLYCQTKNTGVSAFIEGYHSISNNGNRWCEEEYRRIQEQ